jgi:dihydrofolate reductase
MTILDPMITLIVKVDTNNLIGDSQLNRMPRETSTDADIIAANHADMKRFVALRKWTNPETAPDIVIMWRKTWESIPEKYRPFRQNNNYIISRQTNLSLWDTKWETVKVFGSIEVCLTYARENDRGRDIHVIGGGQIYHYVLEHDLADRIDMTILHHEFEWDIYFPQLWSERTEAHRQDFDWYSFITYSKL